MVSEFCELFNDEDSRQCVQKNMAFPEAGRPRDRSDRGPSKSAAMFALVPVEINAPDLSVSIARLRGTCKNGKVRDRPPVKWPSRLVMTMSLLLGTS